MFSARLCHAYADHRIPEADGHDLKERHVWVLLADDARALADTAAHG